MNGNQDGKAKKTRSTAGYMAMLGGIGTALAIIKTS